MCRVSFNLNAVDRRVKEDSPSTGYIAMAGKAIMRSDPLILSDDELRWSQKNNQTQFKRGLIKYKPPTTLKWVFIR